LLYLTVQCREDGDEEDEDMEWDGIEEIVDKGKEKDEEYEDEEQLATVTVVEDFDPHTIIHGAPLTLPPPPPVSHQVIDATKRPPRPARATQSDVTRKKKSGKARTVHYQTKSARKAEKGKQRARRTEKAERAGGNGSARNRIRSANKGAHVKGRRN
jgi:ribosomal RNA-processing protein 17